MCGIWFHIGKKANITYSSNIKDRGPEEESWKYLKNITLGFYRLAINGLNPEGMQPMTYNSITWMCNGEIYNWKELAKEYKIESKSNSDCEVLGKLYLQHRDNLESFFQLLDGVFALVIVDNELNRVIVGRDPYGVRPLFVGDKSYFSSEMKGLLNCINVEPFPPGSYKIYSTENYVHTFGTIIEERNYHTVPFLKNPDYTDFTRVTNALRYALEDAVHKRMLTERPVAALLSGGLDSSLIASLVSKNLRELGLPPLKTFCIGMKGSTDVFYAKKVAEFIGSDHTEIILTADDFLNAIPQVIYDIETYDTTTVRASVGNWLVSKYIREHTDCKVVFNGDGSDEVFGSYLYFNSAPNDYEFEKECHRLLKDIHYFDVLRSDRSISRHGLEPRTPFLDRQFVQIAMSIATKFRRPIKGVQVEKYALRKAFDDGRTLPKEVLWRTKEAFSDGVSSVEKSWYQILQESIPIPKSESWKYDFPNYTIPSTPEMHYYRYLFALTYRKIIFCKNIPYMWMPKWCNATDPSARTLEIYSDKVE